MKRGMFILFSLVILITILGTWKFGIHNFSVVYDAMEKKSLLAVREYSLWDDIKSAFGFSKEEENPMGKEISEYDEREFREESNKENFDEEEFTSSQEFVPAGESSQSPVEYNPSAEGLTTSLSQGCTDEPWNTYGHDEKRTFASGGCISGPLITLWRVIS